MKIIVGLGNPGRKYKKTRHNVGFLVLDQVAEKLNIRLNQTRFRSEYAETNYKQEKIIFMKPQTFMNLSGDAVRQAKSYFDIDPEDILVISDDLNLDRGVLRYRTKGSSGGQKGVQDITNKIKSDQFPRLRVGIGSNERISTVKYVLGKIDSDVAIERAADFVLDYLDGMSNQDLMNKYN